MVSRTLVKVLVIVGLILVFAGIYVMWSGAQPVADQEVFTIPAGAEWYNYYSWSVLSGGHIQGTFTVLNGTPVDVFVYDEADYNAFTSGVNGSGIYHASAASGAFSVDVTGYGTYYLVFQHTSNTTSADQDVDVSLTSSGIDPGWFLGGLAALIIGAILLTYGVLKLRAPAPAPPAFPFGYDAAPAPPPSPGGLDTTPSGSGVFRIPPPLPGTPGTAGTESAAPAAVPPAAGTSDSPTGTLQVSVQNASASDQSFQLFVNGSPVSSATVPAGTTMQASIPVRLANSFGSVMKVEAVTSDGRRTSQDVFVGARGVVPVALRIG